MIKKIAWIFLFLFLTLNVTSGFSERKELVVPGSVRTAEDKNAYGYRAQHLLVERFNQMGQRVKDGEITREQMQDWENTYYRERLDAIDKVILQSRQQMKEDTKYAINLDTDFNSR